MRFEVYPLEALVQNLFGLSRLLCEFVYFYYSDREYCNM